VNANGAALALLVTTGTETAMLAVSLAPEPLD
jgi:hypothetical protein